MPTLLAWMNDAGWFWATISLVAYFLSLPLIVVVLLTKPRQPVSTVAWILVILMMPLIGAVLFLVFGINRVQSRLKLRRSLRRQAFRARPEYLAPFFAETEHFNPTQATLARLVSTTTKFQPTAGNHLLVLHDTTRVFAEIEAAIAAAKHSIHLEYYIWQPDKTGTRLRNLLIERAKAGVAVRFLYDSLGSLRLTRAFLQPMRDAGIQVEAFVPGRSLRERWSINLRSHRKLVIVDGKIAFTGGMNVGDEYLGLSTYFGKWVDTHIRLEGPATLQLQEVFAEDWHYATKEALVSPPFYPEPAMDGQVIAQVLAGGPDSDDSVFQAAMFAAIGEAQHHVTLVTSYFVPTPPLVAALENAAQRGVSTRVLVSGPKTYWYTYHAGRSYYDSLLRAGVEIWEYHGGLLHSKTLTIDRTWSLIGSPNFDARSLHLNFEVAVAVFGAAAADLLLEHFDEDIASAVKIDPTQWADRSWQTRLVQNYCRMFSPVL
jgi:cardiolipin synthase A/B